VQVSSTPDGGRSATSLIREVVVDDAIFRTEELVGLLTHHSRVDAWEPPMPFHQSGVWVLDLTRWQAMNWDWRGRLVLSSTE
jgi:hypothetical protein